VVIDNFWHVFFSGGVATKYRYQTRALIGLATNCVITCAVVHWAMAINRLTTGERRVHRTAASLAQVLITQSPRVRETIALDRNSFQTTQGIFVQHLTEQETQLGLACAAVPQPAPISCHFRSCKAPLSSIVSGAITSELPLPFSYR